MENQLNIETAIKNQIKREVEKAKQEMTENQKIESEKIEKINKTKENHKKNENLKKDKEEEFVAYKLSKDQKQISIAEFFEKNRHLLGFDNKRKALLTTVKEAVDNSLDACEEARILPEIYVEIINLKDEIFRIIVEDNGPGIIKNNIPFAFGKLLYGSKFYSLKQSRGQQGIGISASVLYAQLTTGKPVKIISKIGKNQPAHSYELKINTLKNEPEILKEEIINTWDKESGTRIELDIVANYYKGAQSVDEYLKQTAIVNPHATIIYINPNNEQFIFARGTETLPDLPKKIKPHPYGIEIGFLQKMLKNTKAKNMKSFLKNEFSRVSDKIATEILEKSAINPSTPPQEITRDECERIISAMKKTKIASPPTDCLSPIKEELLEKGLKKEVNAEFYSVSSRKPSVYSGYPFIIEVGLAYGGTLRKDNPATVLRFANRIPLLYQSSSCALTKSVISTDWKKYGLQQPKGSLPIGPIVFIIHICSVWVPYTSEAKESIASYPEIIKETKLALQDIGRRLQRYLSQKRKVETEIKKRSYIEKYIPHISLSLYNILKLEEPTKELIEERLKEILEQKRGKLKDINFDETKNKEFNEEFAIKSTETGILDDFDLEENEENNNEYD